MKQKMEEKLVRDNVPEILDETQVPNYRMRRAKSDFEFQFALLMKLREETEDLVSAATESEIEHVVEEIADVCEVLTALAQLKGIKPVQIARARRKKKEERGGFDGRILLSIP